jgi:hypothetical protein
MNRLQNESRFFSLFCSAACRGAVIAMSIICCMCGGQVSSQTGTIVADSRGEGHLTQQVVSADAALRRFCDTVRDNDQRIVETAQRNLELKSAQDEDVRFICPWTNDWRSDCVIHGEIAWAKRLLEYHPCHVDQMIWEVVFFDGEKELGSKSFIDGETKKSENLIVVDAFSDGLAEVFWSGEVFHPEGPTWKTFNGAGLFDGQVTGIRTTVNGYRDADGDGTKEFVIDTALQDLRESCAHGYYSFASDGIVLAFQRRDDGTYTTRNETSRRLLDRQCPATLSETIVFRERGKLHYSETLRQAHCAIARGIDVQHVHEQLARACMNADYREDCSADLPEGQCDGWNEFMESVKRVPAVESRLPESSDWTHPFEWEPAEVADRNWMSADELHAHPEKSHLVE